MAYLGGVHIYPAPETFHLEETTEPRFHQISVHMMASISPYNIIYINLFYFLFSSGVVWEMKPKNRWKSFNHKNINLLEKAYQNHLSGKTEPGWLKLETGLEVRI